MEIKEVFLKLKELKLAIKKLIREWEEDCNNEIKIVEARYVSQFNTVVLEHRLVENKNE